MLCSSVVVLLDGWLVDLDALCFYHIPDSLLENDEVLWREGVGLCDDWNEVDTCAKSLHDFDIEGLEGVACRTDEVEASVDSEVNLVITAWLLLLKHVRLMLVVEELDDGLPRVAIVHVVSKARGVNNGQPYYTALVPQQDERP